LRTNTTRAHFLNEIADPFWTIVDIENQVIGKRKKVFVTKPRKDVVEGVWLAAVNYCDMVDDADQEAYAIAFHFGPKRVLIRIHAQAEIGLARLSLKIDAEALQEGGLAL